MVADTHIIRALFTNAIENYSPDQWEAFLEEACAEDQALRRRVSKLLSEHMATDCLVDKVVDRIAAPVCEPTPESAGEVIAGYRLLERLGGGGMVTVWLAQQQPQPENQVKRRVVLKLINGALSSPAELARFEAESHLLRLVDHPNIARVLDAGITPRAVAPDGSSTALGNDSLGDEQARLAQQRTPGLGFPYFVMEQVSGIPITDFCNHRQLTIRQRVALLITVCQAVHHAHHRGIVHGDINPSNVLVDYSGPDEQAIAKVVNLGVARTVNQQLMGQSLHTMLGMVAGTLEYMSPEQAGSDSLVVDARSDIYSLGALLYELAVGSPPFMRTERTNPDLSEMVCVIREEKPVLMSEHLSHVQNLTALASSRRTDPKKLIGQVRGELDWIATKCLEKDHNRRYETAQELVADLQNLLNDKPVLAGSRSAWYRFWQFIRRHKP